MSTAAANATCAATFAAGLAHSGVRHCVVSPGSRSTPLALALSRNRAVRVWMGPDERSAGFFALGAAKALRAPVAVLCTSGTAAANLLPAVIEARHGRVPLVVLTADRPGELQGVGAPQTIDQLKLYGGYPRWFAQMPLPDLSPEVLRYFRAAAVRACGVSTSQPPGPTHLNFPFREPFVEEGVEYDPPPADSAPGPGFSHGRQQPDAALIERLASELAGIRRGLIVCGPLDEPGLPEAVAHLASRLSYPVLADALSQVRSGPHDVSFLLDSYDALLRQPDFAAEAPELVLRFGAAPTSKSLGQFLDRHADVRQILVDTGSEWRDPSLAAREVVYCDPVLFCETLAGAVSPAKVSDWTRRWLDADRCARRRIQQALEELDEPFEGRVFSELEKLLPDGSSLYVGNSMPVRDLDSFYPASPRRVRMLCNRGANGIDGVVSSALGAAAVSEGPLLLVIGDVSFYHDMNGLLMSKLHSLNVTVVLVNNDGGGIFSFLPQASVPDFEALFGTPHGLDFSYAVTMFGGRHTAPQSWQQFREAVTEGISSQGLTVVEVRTERAANVQQHREMQRAAAGALGGNARAGAAG